MFFSRSSAIEHQSAMAGMSNLSQRVSEQRFSVDNISAVRPSTVVTVLLVVRCVLKHPAHSRFYENALYKSTTYLLSIVV